MNFDKSRVYTALNADELKVGSKVIVANALQTLKKHVAHESSNTVTLVGISDESYSDRFFDGTTNWCLAYLVEEPKEKQLEWIDLKLGDVITNGKYIVMVTEINKDCEDGLPVFAGHKWFNNDRLIGWVKVENEN